MDTKIKLPDSISEVDEDFFCQSYLTNFDASASFLAVKPESDPKYSRQNGWKLFHRPSVQVKLRELARQKLEKADVDSDKLINELKQIAFLDPQKVMDIDKDGFPVLNLNKCKEHPEILRNMDIQFGVSVTKTGKKVHTYSAKQYDKMEAIDKLLKIAQLYKGEELNHAAASIIVNVNIPLPGANWRNNAAATTEVADAEEL